MGVDEISVDRIRLPRRPNMIEKSVSAVEYVGATGDLVKQSTTVSKRIDKIRPYGGSILSRLLERET